MGLCSPGMSQIDCVAQFVPLCGVKKPRPVGEGEKTPLPMLKNCSDSESLLPSPSSSVEKVFHIFFLILRYNNDGHSKK